MAACLYVGAFGARPGGDPSAGYRRKEFSRSRCGASLLLKRDENGPFPRQKTAGPYHPRPPSRLHANSAGGLKRRVPPWRTASTIMDAAFSVPICELIII
jgi:hypothetical protein